MPTGTDGREMSFYVQRHYGQPSVHLERFVLRTDGFVAVHAGYRGGELVYEMGVGVRAPTMGAPSP